MNWYGTKKWNTDNLSRTDIESLIEKWIFSQRNRDLIKRRLCDGIQYERLSDEFELSVTQVKRIVRNCENIISSHCW